MPGAIDRARAGRPARLTRQVMDDILSGVRTGSPIHWCAEFVGVDRDELRRWRREADAAMYKPRRDWSELESRCVEFFAALRQAEADAGMRLHMALASSAGLTRERPKRRRTRQRIVSAGADTPVTVDDRGQVQGGRVIEVEVTEEELAPSVAAMKMLGAYRFPDEMAAAATDDDDWHATPPGRLDDEALLRILVDAGRRAGVGPQEVIDVPARELPAGDPDDDTPTR